MTDSLIEVAGRLRERLRGFGTGDHTVVGVGSRRDADEQKVPALHIYITPKDNRKVPRFAAFEDVDVVWHVSGPARPLG
jgi:hypothetical protein